MVRRTGSNGQAANANSYRDIRSFFAAGSPRKRALTASKPSGLTGSPVTEKSASQASNEQSGGNALPKARKHHAQISRIHGDKRESPSKVQDENTTPVPEDLDGSSISSVSPPRPHPVVVSTGGSTSTSLSALSRSPSLSSPAKRQTFTTPRHQRFKFEAPAVSSMSPTRKQTDSPLKVRFSPAPSSSRKSVGSGGDTTPVRRLYDKEVKRRQKASSRSPAGKPPFLSPSKMKQLQGTPKQARSPKPKCDDSPSSLLSLPDLPSSPSISGSPSTARKRPTLARDTVIKGSDEEDEDLSDCSLPDLDMLGPVVSRGGGFGTPRARKKLKMVRKSPLTIQPKHKFDFKTLDAHSKRHDVQFDSPKTPKTGKLKRGTITQDVDASPSKARQKLIELAGVKSEEDADKALRAMERAEGSGPRSRWYFFAKESSPRDPIPFPKHGARGSWSFLGKAGTRDRHIMSGMPTNMAASIGLPDELCLWALSMSNTETSAVLRGEYCRLAAADKTQINRLITPRYLAGVFRELGAADHVADETLRPVREARDIYAGRSWTHLRSHLEWLHDIADHLQHESIVYASRTLLRMAVDKVVIENPDVLTSHQLALGALINNVQVDAWDKFCTDMCESLYHGFDKASLRILPLVCMAVTSARLHNLRRRLAIAFFLQDVTLASQVPDEAMSLALVIARVKDSDLRINQKTDYADLKAQVQLLDMAVDDGSFVADVDDPDHEQDYNAAIDDLVGRLKAIWRGINDTGAANIARTEAKSVLDWVVQRLSYSVRTRPPPTQSIFDNQGPSSAKKRKQRDFMLKFVQSRKNKKEDDDTHGEEEESSGADDTFMTACAY